MMRITMRVAFAAAALVLCPLPGLGHDDTNNADTSTPSGSARYSLDEVVVWHSGPEDAEPETIKIGRNTNVRIELHVPVKTEFHLHGYDLTAESSADGVAVFEFRSDHTGRFAITVHGGNDLLGRNEKPAVYLEVHPE